MLDQSSSCSAHAGGADADGGVDRRGLHMAVPPAFDVGGVQQQVRPLDFSQVTGRQLADLGVERPAHGDDLVLREPPYAHLPGDPLHCLQERARQFPHAEEPSPRVGSCCKVSIAVVAFLANPYCG